MSKQNPKNFEAILETDGITAKGFGRSYKMLMKDRRLSIESKSIYNYLTSYAGNGRSAFPGVELICADLCISKSRYYRHLKPLLELGYLSTCQLKNGTVFGKNIYVLHSYPKNPCTQNETSCPNSPHTQNEYTENEGTNNNSLNSNNLNKLTNNLKTPPVDNSYYYNWMEEGLDE